MLLLKMGQESLHQIYILKKYNIFNYLTPADFPVLCIYLCTVHAGLLHTSHSDLLLLFPQCCLYDPITCFSTLHSDFELYSC